MEAKSVLSSPTFQQFSHSLEGKFKCSHFPQLDLFSSSPALLSSLFLSSCESTTMHTLVLGHRLACTCFSSAWGTPFQYTAFSFPHSPQASHKHPQWTQPRLLLLLPSFHVVFLHCSLFCLTSQLNLCKMFCLSIYSVLTVEQKQHEGRDFCLPSFTDKFPETRTQFVIRNKHPVNHC